ncbi:MAG: hypothetical protein Kow0059_10650 [Candidatus Sumerlaeia bacterium]
MSFKPPPEIVAAAMTSTQMYVECLDARLPVKPLLAVEHMKEQHVPVMIEGCVYYKYSCRLPARLKIWPDAHALFMPQEAPTTEIPARLVEYNPHTGMARLAFRHELVSEGGQLRIEPRQVLRRWLKWFERCGGQLTSPADLPAPELDWPSALLEITRDGTKPTPEQIGALEALFASAVSYVYGPPGTGKTNVVLAKALRALAGQGRCALVLARTAELVDEALTAAILEGVAEDKVFRLGIPSGPFLHAYPQLCELRAYEQDITRLIAQLRKLQSELQTLEQLHELASVVQEEQSRLRELNQQLSEKERHYREVFELVRKLDMRARGLHNELYRSRSKLTGERRKRSELKIQEIDREREALETELEFITKTIKTLQQERDQISKIAALLTSRRKKDIDDQIAENEKRRAEIQAQIDDIAHRKKMRAGSYKKLTDNIFVDETVSDSMERKLQQLRDQLAEQRPRLEQAEREFNEARERIKPVTNSLREHAANLQNLMQQHQIANTDQTPQRIAALQAEIPALEQQIQHYRQDLSSRAIIGMTVDAFISFAAHQIIKADHIFVDDAHTIPVVKILPLLRLGVPITLLGDIHHMPPCCAHDDDPVIRAFWAQPAAFLEAVFRHGQDFDAIAQSVDPQWHLTRNIPLTLSFRLSAPLAQLLDSHIYRMNLAGDMNAPPHLWQRHCEPYSIEGAQQGVNESEAEEAIAVVEHFIRTGGVNGEVLSLAILTPGPAQAECIREKLRRLNEQLLDVIDVMTIHQAPGLFWDYVLFSVTDTSRLPGGGAGIGRYPLCTRHPEGRMLLNTALTRARKQTILLLDRTYWAQHNPPCLLAEAARSAPVFELTAA